MKTKQSTTHRRYGRAAIIFAAFLLLAALLTALPASATDFSWTKDKVAVHYGTNLKDPDGNNIEAWFTVDKGTNPFGFERTASQAHHIMHDYRAVNPNSSSGLNGTRNIDFVECFCIAPGVSIHGSGDGYSNKVYSSGNAENMAEFYYRKLGDRTVAGDKGPASQKMLNLALHFGYPYRSDVSTSGEANACYAATQLIVWQCMYGWRTDASTQINDRSVGYGGHAGTMTEQYTANGWVNYYYTAILRDMAEYLQTPDFGSASYTMEWNSARNRYEVTLTDTNGVLGNYTASVPSGSGVSTGKTGNTLTLFSADQLPPSGVPVTFTKEAAKTENFFAWTAGDDSQQMISGAGEVTVNTRITVRTGEEPAGNLQIRKTSEDGKVGGIGFKLYGPFSEKQTSFTGAKYLTQNSTDAAGYLTATELKPGWYWVEEMDTGDARYVLPAPQCVHVISGETATVSFHNTLKTGSVRIRKNSDDGIKENRKFTLSGVSDSGQRVFMEETTNSIGVALFRNVPPGTYKLAEVFDDAALADFYAVEIEGGDTVTVKAGGAVQKTVTNRISPAALLIRKSADDGKIAGMKFKLSGKTDSGVSKTYTAVTDENGEAHFPSVFPGEYTLTEQFASSADLEKYTVTFSGDGIETATGGSVRIRLAPNQTAEMIVDCHNGMHRGEVKVVKSSYDGRKDGFTFRLYGESKYEGSIDLRATTDYSGAAWFVDVPVGTYTLEEVDIPDKYLSPQPQQVTVTEDSKGELAATAEFYNDKKDPQYGILRVKKTSDDNTVWGFKFHLYGIAEMESLGGDVIELVEIDEYAETDPYGNAYFKPVPVNGSYLLEEVEFPAQYEPQEPVDVSFINEETGEYVQEKTVSFHNSLKDGTVTVKKTADDGIVEGISFSLYTPMSDGAQYAEIVTTDATGTAVFTGVPLETTLVLEEVLYGGKYRVEFTLEGNEEKIEGPMVEFYFAGTTTVYAHNKLPRGNVKIQKTSDDGILEGFRFRLYGESDSEGPVDRYAQTDETGAALFVNVPVGTYTVEEVDVPDRYETPEPVSVTVTEDHTAELPCTVSFRNRLRPGSITVWKYRGDTGAPAAGAEFLLEWSDDGVLWQEKQRLITGEDGYACFEGLEVSLYYRLTETKAPEGLQLMTAPVFEGKLPEENTDVSLEVVNNSLPTLPHTGKNGFGKWIPTATLGSFAACSAVFFHRRRKNENGGKEA